MILTRDTPWGNNLDVGLQAVEGKLETNLVVALARAAVGDKLAAFLLGDADLGSRDDGAGERGAEQVAALVGGVTLNSAEAELFDEFTAEVEDHLRGAVVSGVLEER